MMTNHSAPRRRKHETPIGAVPDAPERDGSASRETTTTTTTLTTCRNGSMTMLVVMVFLCFVLMIAVFWKQQDYYFLPRHILSCPDCGYLQEMYTSSLSLSSHQIAPYNVSQLPKVDEAEEPNGYWPRHDDSNNTSHCFFRTYPQPKDPQSGLPFVADVFTSHNHTLVYIAVEGRSKCQFQYQKAHDFFRPPRTFSYDCIFETDGSHTKSLPLRRFPRVPNRGRFFVIACPVPKHLQSTLPRRGARSTTSHLTLQSTLNLITGRPLIQPRQVSRLPICSHAWPLEDAMAVPAAQTQPQPPRHKLSIVTRVSTSYHRQVDGQPLTVTQPEFQFWLDYHLSLGVDHFYIYDDSPHRNDSLIATWCEPYVRQGHVTYIHYPYPDFVCPQRKQQQNSGMGGQFLFGQSLASNAALRRYEHETEWMGHWDVDEFLYLEQVTNATTLDAFLETHGAGYDALSWERYIYGPCDSSLLSLVEPQTPVATRLFRDKACRRAQPDGKPKSIFRTSVPLYHNMHVAELRMDGSEPIIRTTTQLGKGHFGHFRKGNAAGKEFPVHSRVFEQVWSHLQPKPDQRVAS